MTLVGLLHTRTSPTVSDRYFLPLASKESRELLEVLHLLTSNQEVMNVEDIVAHFP